MIISRTSTRISFLGGGTDYPEWYLEHGGAVIATTINKYVWVLLNNGHIASSYDVPAKSGLATSSAQTVGLLKILAELNSKDSDPELIAQIATFVERDKLSNKIGVQDQYLCSHGGFMLLRFSEVGIRHTVIKDIDWLNPYLMLFHTHQYRKRAGDVVSVQLNEMGEHTKAYFDLMELVEQGLKAIEAKDWESFGLILHKSWLLKRTLSSVITTEAIDEIYNTGLEAGAVGGKLLGSGGGGAMLFLAPLDKQENIRQTLSKCEYIPFKFEERGSLIVYRDDKISHRR